MSGTVLYERDGAVATLTLSRPERLNAIVPELIDDLEAALDRAVAARVAQLPANQSPMMKLLVNQAYDQMGLPVTQLIGTLLDGAARHTPEGVAFTREAMEDVRGAVARRDAPFGDYGQEGR